MLAYPKAAGGDTHAQARAVAHGRGAAQEEGSQACEGVIGARKQPKIAPRIEIVFNRQQIHLCRASTLAELKMDLFIALGDDEAAIGEAQRALDAFPTGPRTAWFERVIMRLAGAEHDADRSDRERWAKALKDGCADDMDLRVGPSVSWILLGDKLQLQALVGAVKPKGQSNATAGGIVSLSLDI